VSNLPFLDVEDCASNVSLREDCLFIKKVHDLPALADSGKELPWVEVAIVFGQASW
jgi:hypothetical protein